MTIKMRLDTAGLRALIADNPELEVEIQNTVLKNIQKEQIENAVAQRIEGCLTSMCERKGWYGNWSYTVKDNGLKQAIFAVVEEQAKLYFTTIVQETVNTAVQRAVTKAKSDMMLELKGALLATITPQMAREILLEALK